MKTRRIFVLVLLIVSILAGIAFWISLSLQPHPISSLEKGALAVAAIVGVVSFLAALKDILELFDKLFDRDIKSSYNAKQNIYKGKGPLRIFLCHASQDKPAVIQLYDKLKADQYEPWLDKLDLLPGQDWDYEIRKAVISCHIVIICLSSRSINKEGYIQREIGHALDIAEQQPKGTIYLIPLRLENCDVPERLCRWQWVNYYEENGYKSLLKALQLRQQTLKLKAAKRTKDISKISLYAGPSQKHFLKLPFLVVVHLAIKNWFKNSFYWIKTLREKNGLKRWGPFFIGIIGIIPLFWGGFLLFSRLVSNEWIFFSNPPVTIPTNTPDQLFTSTSTSPTKISTPTIRPTKTVKVTFTPSPSTTPLPCNSAQFISDVSVPDGTTFSPGENFTKTWRLKNTGTCTWTTNYDIVFAEGVIMEAPVVLDMPHDVAPGQVVEISIPMKAPTKVGEYRNAWKLRDNTGHLFGLNRSNAVFYVIIKVVK